MMRDLTGKAKPCPMCGSERIYLEEPTYEGIFDVKNPMCRLWTDGF